MARLFQTRSMFIGHYAVSLASKRADPKTNLGVYFFAASFLDLIWPLFALAGLEHVKILKGATQVNDFDFVSYPFSHSLVMSLVWSFLVGGIFYFVSNRKKSAIFVGLAVFSHWVLDFVTHRPDMPIGLSPDTIKLGLGLWYSMTTTIIVEVILFSIAVFLYAQANYKRLSKKQKVGFVSLIVFFIFMYFASLFGPRPPLDATTQMIAGPAAALWLFVLWGWLVDKKPA